MLQQNTLSSDLCTFSDPALDQLAHPMLGRSGDKWTEIGTRLRAFLGCGCGRKVVAKWVVDDGGGGGGGVQQK